MGYRVPELVAPEPPNVEALDELQFTFGELPPSAPDRKVPVWSGGLPPSRPDFEVPQWERVWDNEVATVGKDFVALAYSGEVTGSLGKCAFVFKSVQPQEDRSAILHGAIGAGIQPMDLGALGESGLEWSSGARGSEAARFSESVMRLKVDPTVVGVVRLEVDPDSIMRLSQSLGFVQDDMGWRYRDLSLDSPVSSWVHASPWSPLQPDSVCLVHLAKQSVRDVRLSLFDLDARLDEFTEYGEAVNSYNYSVSDFNRQMVSLDGAWAEYVARWTAWSDRRRGEFYSQKETFDAMVAEMKAADDEAWAEHAMAHAGQGTIPESRPAIDYPSFGGLPPVRRVDTPSVFQGGIYERELIEFQDFEDELMSSSEIVIPCIDTRIVAEFVSTADGTVLSAVDVRWTVPAQFVELPTSLLSGALKRALGN